MTDKPDPAAAPSAEDEARAMWADIDKDTGANAQPPSDEAGDAEARTTEADDDATPPSDEGRGADADADVDWSTVPEPVRKAVEAERASHRREIQRHARRQALLEQRLRSQETPPAQQRQPAPEQQAEIDPIREDYPEVSEWMLKQVKPLQEAVKALTLEKQAQVEKTLEINYQRVAETIPEDFFSEHGKDFAAWVETEASVADNKTFQANKQGFVDPDGAIRVVQNYLRAIGADSASPPPSKDGAHRQQDRRQRQLDSASSPRARSRGAATGLPRDGDPATLWDMTEV